MVDISYNKTNLIAYQNFYLLRFESPALSLSLLPAQWAQCVTRSLMSCDRREVGDGLSICAHR